MKLRIGAVGAVLSMLCSVASAQRPAPGPTGISKTAVTLTYLGAAGWEITDRTTVILVDPYFSRVPLVTDRSILGRAEGADRRPVDPNTVVTSDTAAVDAHVRRADFILLHHAHIDHVLDAPTSHGRPAPR